MAKNLEWFDVIVTTNLFGDIVTDQGAMVLGGMGIAASGNINPGKHGMFERIHGSAPKYTGQNVDNPLGAIAAAGMMLDFPDEKRAAVASLLASRRISSVDAECGLSTTEIGDTVAQEIVNGR